MGAKNLLWKLAGLRFRERTLSLLWGAARLGALVVGVVLFACLFDWAVDDAVTVNAFGDAQDVPDTRLLLLWLMLVLGVLAILTGLFWIVVPLASGSIEFHPSGWKRLAALLSGMLLLDAMLTWILFDPAAAMDLNTDGSPGWVHRLLLCLIVLGGVGAAWFWAGWPFSSGRLNVEAALARLIAVIFCTAFFVMLMELPGVNRGGQGTPHWLNRLLLGATIVTTLFGVYYWLVLPLTRRLSDDTLALWVENHYPQLGHRLITTVQLARDGAYRQGMSPELIELTTAQTQEQCRSLSFAGVADHSRLGWAAAIGVPTLFVAALPFLAAPELAGTLFARHLLADAEIPRHIRIESAHAQLVRPINEPFTLDYWVSARDGVFPEGEGRVIARLSNRYSDIHALKPVLDDAETPRTDDHGRRLYRASIKSASAHLSHIAQLGDGRSKVGHVQMVPRPTIARLYAWNVLPVEYVGVSPLGLPYMVQQSQGDIVGILRSMGHVEAEVEHAIRKARLDLLVPERAKKDDEDVFPEKVGRSFDMEILKREKNGQAVHVAKCVFDLRPEETAYRITVYDEHGLENVPPLTRRVFVKEEDAPEVLLRKDYWTDHARVEDPINNYEREGVPVPVGEAVRVPYVAYGPLGVGKAQFLFRLLKKQESAADLPPETPWIRLDLKPHTPNPSVDGAFDERRGVFENTKNSQSIEFYPVPAPEDEPFKLPYTIAGGRFHFQTKFLKHNDGKPLAKGDMIEYCIEVWPRHLDDTVSIETRPVGRSKPRVITLGSYKDFEDWLKENQDELRRLKELEKKQSKVFGTQ
jgi:hypothetical protein